jgi:hypothetical protein
MKVKILKDDESGLKKGEVKNIGKYAAVKLIADGWAELEEGKKEDKAPSKRETKELKTPKATK